MTTLPTNREVGVPRSDHIADHNEIHRLHNDLDGLTAANAVTLNTAQTITGAKTFSATLITAGITASGNVSAPGLTFSAKYFASAAATGAYIATDGPLGAIEVNARNAANVALVVMGRASQTADLQQWQNSAGTVLARVNPVGSALFSGASNGYVYVGNDVANTVALEVGGYFTGWAQSGAASRGSLGAIVVSNFNTGRFQASLGGDVGLYAEPRVSNVVAGILRGFTGQTADLQQWQNSAGTVLARVNSAGTYVADQGIKLPTAGGPSSPVSAIEGPGGQRFFVNASNSWVFGQGAAAVIAEFQDDRRSAFHGGFRANVSGLSQHTIDAIRPGGTSRFIRFDDGASGELGFIDRNLGQSYTLQSASTVGLIIKGAASQTADLQQWQDSAGTVLARVQSSGYAVGTGFAGVSVDPTWVPMTATGAAGQTADLQTWRNSTPTVLAGVAADGAAYFQNGNYRNPARRFEIYADTQYSVNRIMSYAPTGQVPSTLVFTVFGADAPYQTPTDVWQVHPTGTMTTVLIASSSVGHVVKGAAGQTADLQQWQNSAGGVLSRVNNLGQVTGPVRGTELYTDTVPSYITAKAAVAPAFAGEVGLVIKGFASQSADVQQWQDSAGTVLARVLPNGGISTASGPMGSVLAPHNAPVYGYSAYFGSIGTTTPVLMVRGAASQTADLQQWQNSAGTVLAKIKSDGTFFTNTALLGTGSDLGAHLSVVSTSGATNIMVRGAGGQTADLQQWQNSAGTVLALIDSIGRLRVAPNGIPGSPAVTTSSAEFRVGTNFDSRVVIGESVEGSAHPQITFYRTSAGLNAGRGNRIVMPSSELGLHFQVAAVGDATYGTETYVDRAILGTSDPGAVGLVVKGVTGQTADLQQWQNSAGTVLAKVDAVGDHYIGTGRYSVHSGGRGVLVGGGTAGEVFTTGGQFRSDTGFNTSTTGTGMMLEQFQVRRGTLGPILSLGDTGGTAFSFAIQSALAHTALTTFTTPTAATIGLIINGAASQTADLTQWKNSAGTVHASVASDGKVRVRPQGLLIARSDQGDSVSGGGWLGATLNYGSNGLVSVADQAGSTLPWAGNQIQSATNGATRIDLNSLSLKLSTKNASHALELHDPGAGTGNVLLFGHGTGNVGGGVGVLAVSNATTVPATNPSGGGVLYAEGGALKWRGSSGTVTTIAAA